MKLLTMAEWVAQGCPIELKPRPDPGPPMWVPMIVGRPRRLRDWWESTDFGAQEYEKSDGSFDL